MKKLFVVLVMLVAMNASGQWVQMSNGIGGSEVISLAVVGSNIFAGTYGYGIFVTSNNGTNWTQSGLPGFIIDVLLVSGTNIFAGTGYHGVYLSTNNGINWNSTGLTTLYVLSLAVSGTNLFAGTFDNGVLLSTNNGINWTAVNNGLTNNMVLSLAVSGTNIFAATYDNPIGTGGVFLSTNNGTNWTAVNNGLTTQYVHSLLVSGTNIFAGSLGDGVFISTNNGTNWTTAGLAGYSIWALAVSGTNLFAGTMGVYMSTNNGTNWFEKNQWPNYLPQVVELLIANDYIFAGTYDNSVWRRSYSEILDIQKVSTIIPTKYFLSQNYPNPFNPTSKIKFAMPKAGDAKVIVFDVMGREVQTLVNERLQPGTYETTFDGSALNSGVYFYKITTGNYSETKRMMLLK